MMLDKLCSGFVEQLQASQKLNDIFCLIGSLGYAVQESYQYIFVICYLL